MPQDAGGVVEGCPFKPARYQLIPRQQRLLAERGER